MSKLEELILKYCPDGVERVLVGSLIDLYTGVQLNKSEMHEIGSFPVINGGVNPSGYIEQFNEEADTITVSQGGASAGYVNYITSNFWAGAHCFVVKPSERKVNKRYLYNFLKNEEYALQHTQQGAGIPSVNRDTINSLLIPLPPLPVQEEIVRILDSMVDLQNNIEAELKERKKQYDYYKNKLLSFEAESNSARWMTLREVGVMLKGSGIQKKDFMESGTPCIHYGQIHTFYKTFTYKTISFVSPQKTSETHMAHTGDLIIATTSEDVEACCKAVAWLGEDSVAVSGDAHIFRHNQNPKYMSYLFQTEMFAQQKRKVARGAKVVRVHGEDLLKFKFAFPSLKEQARIVNILDNFETLINDKSKGILAEIEERRKQYEYYRNKILSFE